MEGVISERASERTRKGCDLLLSTGTYFVASVARGGRDREEQGPGVSGHPQPTRLGQVPQGCSTSL